MLGHPQRSTKDWDFGVRVESWNEFEQFVQALLATRQFIRISVAHKLLYAKEVRIDLVPFGGVEQDGLIVWPDTQETMDQNRTMQASEAGQQIAGHRKQGLEVHLCVRRSKKVRGQAMPFVYCGEVDFVDWGGEQPITVRWRLRNPLPDSLAAEFSSGMPTT